MQGFGCLSSSPWWYVEIQEQKIQKLLKCENWNSFRPKWKYFQKAIEYKILIQLAIFKKYDKKYQIWYKIQNLIQNPKYDTISIEPFNKVW